MIFYNACIAVLVRQAISFNVDRATSYSTNLSQNESETGDF